LREGFKADLGQWLVNVGAPTSLGKARATRSPLPPPFFTNPASAGKQDVAIGLNRLTHDRFLPL
jgi:hypothetical protein